MEQALQHLLTAYNNACPTGVNQAAMVKELNEFRKDESDPKRVLTYAVGRFYDGLKYGNWPGTGV